MDAFRRFLRNDAGVSAIEFGFMVPLLLLTLVGAVTLFDLFRNVQNVEKATFTIGDMLSRQTTITDARMNEMQSLMTHMVNTASDGQIRVSSIANVGGSLDVVWSEHTGDVEPEAPLPMDIIPEIAEGDSVLLTETFVPHTAFVDWFGIGDHVFTSRAVHRPRFVSSVSYF